MKAGGVDWRKLIRLSALAILILILAVAWVNLIVRAVNRSRDPRIRSEQEFLDTFNEAMAEHGITLLALKPSHHKDQWVKHFRQIIFRFRRKIETVFSQLTCQMNGEQVLARSFWGLCSRVGYKILAHNLAMVVIFCSTGCLSTASMIALIF